MARTRDRAAWARAAWRAGMIGPMPPRAALTAARAMRGFGPIGATTVIGAARFGARTAVIDDAGPVTFRELDAASDAVASAWAGRGAGPGDRIAILCRNHRGFIVALSAAAKLGARIILLNTDFAAPQLASVVAEQGVTLLAHDAEFAGIVAGLSLEHGLDTAWDDGACDFDRFAPGRPQRPPARPSTLVILSSGTTGAPKGARRSSAPPEPLALPGGVLSRIPFRGGERVLVAPPLFHGWGLTAATLTLALGSTLVLHRRFDAARVRDALAEEGCAALVAVPTMLGRLLDSGAERLPSLRIVAVGGGPLSAELTHRATTTLGPVLYNFYGSTEASCIAIATPADLAAAPGCVGTPPPGTAIRILGPDDAPVPAGEIGRIHVTSPTRFEGYTSGAAAPPPLLPIGDLGFADPGGRLHLTGRADDMIVSGGENVHPQEIEDLLTAHPDIAEAAVVGVPDPEFGHRLRAHVVPSSPGLTEADIKNLVLTSLARHKVPRDVVLRTTPLPRTPTGKIRKHLLDRDAP